ncbi:flagellar protein FlgN [Bacillus sp. AGMB 02131]|uniref:Flagellar protein FlgN n=1 Tax=Peribacillus faecalis TaxID=2772559 RepID=A0A927HAB7_9BACI|nr:flagellar protein FlgN [Peribacillus faecalis]MBD3108500.1 flagellar protein FlgN [Peribacillus faecalis]
MSAATIIKQLDQLIQLHSSLHKLTAQKTEAIKTNDIDSLNTLLNAEQKHVKAIEQIESARQQEVIKLLAAHNRQTSDDFQDVLEVAAEKDKQQLISKRDQLLHIIEELKNQNSLNQQLIFHSLQYINISLDMLRPQNQQANFNYEKPAAAKQGLVNRAMFDSKA